MPVLKYVKKLEGILKIGDIVQRQEALITYARSLQVNAQDARKFNGEIDEDQLTVLIFNAERTRTMFRFRKIGLLVATFLLFITLIAATIIFVRF